MKVLQVVPAQNTAITILAKQIAKHNPDIEIRMATFHPKRPDTTERNTLGQLWLWADVIDMQYWKSGATIRQLYPKLWPMRRKLLSHYNPYNLHEEPWNDYEIVVVVNSFQHKELPKARLVPLCIDLDFFKFNRSNYTVDPIVNMVVNRIEGKKGVYEVAKACKELDYKFILVGRVSDPAYMEKVRTAAGTNLDFRQSVSDEEVRKSYYQSAIHVCNSVNNYESGTLPILEAMACGTPVMSRMVGHVPDLYNGKNLHIYEGSEDNVQALKERMKVMMDSRNYRIGLRLEGEKTAQTRSDKWRAAEYRKLYQELTK